MLRTVGLWIALCFLTTLIAPERSWAQLDDVVTLKQALKSILQTEGAKSLKKSKFAITTAQRQEIKKRYGIDAANHYLMFTGLNAEKAAVGVALVIDIEGKEGPLQMVVGVRPDSGVVYNLGFTIFGEERGKPAATPSYLKQYLGRDARDALVVGKDIDGVTGATRTSESVALGVRTATRLFEYLVLNKKGELSK